MRRYVPDLVHSERSDINSSNVTVANKGAASGSVPAPEEEEDSEVDENNMDSMYDPDGDGGNWLVPINIFDEFRDSKGLHYNVTNRLIDRLTGKELSTISTGWISSSNVPAALLEEWNAKKRGGKKKPVGTKRSDSDNDGKCAIPYAPGPSVEPVFVPETDDEKGMDGREEKVHPAKEMQSSSRAPFADVAAKHQPHSRGKRKKDYKSKRGEWLKPISDAMEKQHEETLQAYTSHNRTVERYMKGMHDIMEKRIALLAQKIAAQEKAAVATTVTSKRKRQIVELDDETEE